MKSFFSTKNVFTTHNLIVMALMVALKIILSQFTIFPTPTFKLISFAYLPGAMVSMLYGPWAGLVFGLVGDTVGYIVKPAGPYFFGYAISEMVTNLIYAVFLYKKPLKIWRVAAAKVIIILTVFCGINFLWNVIMYGAVASKFFTWQRIINYFIQTPLSVSLTVIMARIVFTVYKKPIGYLSRNE